MATGELDRGVTVGADTIEFRFQDLHRHAVLKVDIHRTLRVPDDGSTYNLPAGLGRFPVLPVGECRVSEKTLNRGGVVIPMWQSEAAWISFRSSFPFLVLIAAGKINAVTGETWQDAPDLAKQNYLVVPAQPWLDGFRIDSHTVRQFVATTIGQGDTVEEQLTGEGIWGGLQIRAIPMKPSAYWELIERKEIERAIRQKLDAALKRSLGIAEPMTANDITFSRCAADAEMGMAAGGRILQHIEPDPYPPGSWMSDIGLRCFIHLINAQQYEQISGRPCPSKPLSEAEYKRAGIPWFTHYGSGSKLESPTILSKVRSLLHGR